MAYYNPYMQPYGGGYQMPIQQQPQSQNGILWVQGEAGAKAWTVAPGQSVVLMDSENPALYLKSADYSGVPNMRVYDLVERVTRPQNAPQISTEQFITRKEFEEYKAAQAAQKEVVNDGESAV